MAFHSPNRRAGTLIELLVVIALLSVLAGMTTVAVSRVRAASLRTTCANNLRQLGLALHRYESSHSALPPGVVHPLLYPSLPRMYGPDTDPYPLMNWHARLLPYLEQDALWRQILAAYEEDKYEFDTPAHVAVRRAQVATFACPADTSRKGIWNTRGQTSYLGIEGVVHHRDEGVLFMDSSVRMAEITDGTSTTLFVGERPPSANLDYGRWHTSWGAWGTLNSTLGVREKEVGGWIPGCHDGPYPFRPGSLKDPCSVFHFWSLHGGGANFLFGDGSVRFLPYKAASLLPALATRAGGEAAPPLD